MCFFFVLHLCVSVCVNLLYRVRDFHFHFEPANKWSKMGAHTSAITQDCRETSDSGGADEHFYFFFFFSLFKSCREGMRVAQHNKCKCNRFEIAARHLMQRTQRHSRHTKTTRKR